MVKSLHLCDVRHIDDWSGPFLLDALHQPVNDFHNVTVVLPAKEAHMHSLTEMVMTSIRQNLPQALLATVIGNERSSQSGVGLQIVADEAFKLREDSKKERCQDVPCMRQVHSQELYLDKSLEGADPGRSRQIRNWSQWSHLMLLG